MYPTEGNESLVEVLLPDVPLQVVEQSVRAEQVDIKEHRSEPGPDHVPVVCSLLHAEERRHVEFHP